MRFVGYFKSGFARWASYFSLLRQRKVTKRKATRLSRFYSQLSTADLLTPSGPSAEPTFKTRCVLFIFVKNFFDGRLAVSAERVAGVTFLKIFNKNGRLTRGFRSFSVTLRWRYFPKNEAKKWAIYTGELSFSEKTVCDPVELVFLKWR